MNKEKPLSKICIGCGCVSIDIWCEVCGDAYLKLSVKELRRIAEIKEAEIKHGGET
jgi:hypothetical protein